MMRTKLDSILSADKIKHAELADNKIYIADFSNITNSARGVEANNVKPEDMEVLVLHNNTLLSITVSIFGNQCFTDEQNREVKHCECVVYPTDEEPDNWTLFVEIKDCKPKNVSSYFKEAKQQIIETVKIFRKRNLLDVNKKVHAVISFPRNKTDFHRNMIGQKERQDFLRLYKIIIRGNNAVVIENKKVIK